MKIYPHNSTLTIRQRIETASKQKRKHDIWVNVHDNTDGDGNVFGFYLSDWDNGFDSFKDHKDKELDYRLDNETKSEKYLNLGFDGFSPMKKRF